MPTTNRTSTVSKAKAHQRALLPVVQKAAVVAIAAEIVIAVVVPAVVVTAEGVAPAVVAVDITAEAAVAVDANLFSR